MDPKTQDAQKPPRLTFSELNLDRRKKKKWIQAFRCVKMYHTQAVDLSKEESDKTIEVITKGDYIIQRTGEGSPGAHKIYRYVKDRHQTIFYTNKLEWIHYLILKAMYPDNGLGVGYMNAVKQKFLDGEIRDSSNENYEIYPDIGEEMREFESTIESGHEQDDDNHDTLTMNQDQRQKLIDQLTREDLENMGSDRKVTKNGVALILTTMEFRNAAIRTMPSSKRPVDTAPLIPSIGKTEQAPAKASSATLVSFAKKLKSATKKTQSRPLPRPDGNRT
ncbi:hypothetical protein V8C34DRAFT_326652 [Trichoderma compactum]